MGLFDNVKCLIPLPWPEVQDTIFQTKSPCDVYLNDWEIRADGSLWKRIVEREWVDDPKALLGMWHKEVSSRWEEQEWQGEFTFYELTNDNEWWYEVQLWVKGNRVADMICTKRPSYSAKEAKGQPPVTVNVTPELVETTEGE